MFKRIAALAIAFWLLHFSAEAQKDTISYNSTCIGYAISFGSNLFDSIPFPDKVVWNFGDPASGIYNTAQTQYPKHSFAAPGNYLIQMIAYSAGDSVIVQRNFQVQSPIAWNFGPDIFLCQKGSALLNGPVVPGATYQWNDDSLTATPSLRVQTSGVYTVKINGCAVSDSIGVFFSDSPRIDLGASHNLCAGEILTLNATSQNGSYQWMLNGTLLSDTLGQLKVDSPGGNYKVIVSVPGCGVYTDSVNITFSSLPAPPFSLGPDTLLCPGMTYTLSANVTGATAYAWSTKETTPTIVVNQQGLYWAFVTVNSQCEVVDTVEVDYRGDKNLQFHDTAICKGTTLVLNADFGTGIYNWVANPPQRNDQNQTGQSTYYVYEPGEYKVTAQVGACSYSDSLRVSFNDSLFASIGKDTTLCIGEPYVLHLSTNANTFVWQDGSMGLNYSVQSAGNYQVIAQNGCGSDTVSVKIDLRHCACELIMPNAFTPNGDGLNETFRPLHPCEMTDFHLRIYNRFGELIFQSADPTKGWNGYFGMEPALTGTYVWAVDYISLDTKQKNYRKGFVVLLR